MGLQFFVGEVQGQINEAVRMKNEGTQAIAQLQGSIAQFLSAPLSGKAYTSAKNYFTVAYTPLCRALIMSGEALVSAHKRLLSEYQSTVGSIDTVEDDILEQIRTLEDLKCDLSRQMSEAKTMRPDLEKRYINACDCITKRKEKIQKLQAYSAASASFFDDYNTCQSQYLSGLAQVQNSKAWNSASGSFDLGLLDMSWAVSVNERWTQREKMKQEELKKADEVVVKALEKHGLTKDDLVQVTDTEEIVYQKYIQFAKLGLHPHTGLPLTDSEKVKFQYAAHAGTWSNLIGTVGGAYAGQKAASNDFYSKKSTDFDILDEQLGSMKGKVKVNKYESAENINNWWKNQGYKEPPYPPRTVVQDIELLADTKFVRVYDGTNSNLYGGWLMRLEDIKGLTPAQIQNKFALPHTPTYVGEVTIPKGSSLRIGEVNPLFGHEGGGVQFDLKGQYIGEFKELGKINEWSGLK